MTESLPFARPGLFRRAGPFLLATFVAFALTPLQPYGDEPFQVLLAAGFTGLIIATATLMPWQHLPRFAQCAPPLAFFVVIALLTQSQGGASSGYSPLVMLPVFWLALYGTQVELFLAVGGVAAALLVPFLLVGGTAYPPAELRHTLIWILVAPLVGLTVQGLVRKLRLRAEESAQRAEELLQSERETQLLVESMAAVNDVTREVARSNDLAAARQTICDAARRILDASFGLVLERNDVGLLVPTACSGCELDGDFRLPVGAELPGPAAAAATGRPLFVGDARKADPVTRKLAKRLGAVSLHVEPVVSENEGVGILVVGWTAQVDGLPDRSVSAVRVLAGETALALERAALLERLERSARTDDLTGLPNRRAWQEHLPRELARSRREDRDVCVVMLDLDHFKVFNDARGHQAGDDLLRRSADAWREQLRQSDLLARYGGEEFSLVLPGCGPKDAEVLVERLRASTPGGQTLSAGIAVWNREESADTLVGRADAALYTAKREGRDRIVLATAA